MITRCIVTALLLFLHSPSGAGAQPSSESAARPLFGIAAGLAVGGDVYDNNGMQLHGGLFLENSHGRFLTSVVEASAWMTLVTCANDVEGCAAGGWRTAARLNLSPLQSSNSVVRPYVGGGIGAMALRSTHFAYHYRFGVAFGLPQGPVADLGITTDMLSGGSQESLRLLTFGVGWTVGRT